MKPLTSKAAKKAMAEIMRCHHDEPCTTIVLKQADEIKGLRKRLDSAETALKVICTWASFDNGAMLDPKHVKSLCRRTLAAMRN